MLPKALDLAPGNDEVEAEEDPSPPTRIARVLAVFTPDEPDAIESATVVGNSTAASVLALGNSTAASALALAEAATFSGSSHPSGGFHAVSPVTSS